MQNRKRDTDVQNRLLDSVGEGGGGMFWENSITTCILSRVKQITMLVCLDSIFKSRDITFPVKVRPIKALVFSVVMYGCESWTVKKTEYWKIDAFELWCWRLLLKVPCTAKRSSQSILKEISPEYSLEGLMQKLEFLCFAHLMGRTESFEETLMLGKVKDGSRRGHDRGWDGWMASPTQWTLVLVNSRSWWWTGRPGMLQSMGSWRDTTEWLNWTEWHDTERLFTCFFAVYLL